jgi:Osmosensitive K+ channel His kinase sensor domain
VVEYRGSRLEEMDLDAVLRRRPEIALVDELAHTNVPGSGPHEKRWQDVLDMLDAGIDVVTTVNIQHLESIADDVEHMTGAKVRERVPDWLVRKADQIELADSSPEQLRRRMLHGNIYPNRQATCSEVRSVSLAAVLFPGGRWRRCGIDVVGEFGGVVAADDGCQPSPEPASVRCGGLLGTVEIFGAAGAGQQDLPHGRLIRRRCIGQRAGQPGVIVEFLPGLVVQVHSVNGHLVPSS